MKKGSVLKKVICWLTLLGCLLAAACGGQEAPTPAPVVEPTQEATAETVSEPVDTADVLTAEHPAVAGIAEACAVEATVSAELCAQLRTLHRWGALPFDIDFSIVKAQCLDRSETSAHFDMGIQAPDGRAYSFQWSVINGHGVLVSIFGPVGDDEERLFYAGEYTEQKYHHTGLDEASLLAENAEQLQAAYGLDLWAASSVLNQLNALEDGLSTPDAPFSYAPFDTVTVLEQTSQGLRIRISPLFSGVPDADFLLNTVGIVPVIEPVN